MPPSFDIAGWFRTAYRSVL